MELYAHNLRAYENAMRIFEHRNETCIIHPTGTGKAVIIATCINEHPNDTHLVLAPGTHIFDEIIKHCSQDKFNFLTYPSIQSSLDESPTLHYTFIYLDEFHRIGAEKWGLSVQHILKNNPGAKKLGTTATHIRFLDEERDMAQEIFKGSIASHISLHKAFIEGILWPPKYVNAVYSIDEEYYKLAARIETSKAKDKKILASELNARYINWKKANGLNSIIRKHLPPDRKKIVIFCNSLREMKTTEEILTPIFQSIFKEMSSIHVHSAFGDSYNEMMLDEFRKSDGITKILYAVDKLNEGLHGSDLSVTILMRHTSSPNLFYQQIGRCFSVGQKEQPIIFDFVNNFRHIQIDMFKKDYDAEMIAYYSPLPGNGQAPNNLNYLRNASIEFIDETQDIVNIFQSFEYKIQDWEISFQKAKHFFDLKGHLNVPKSERSLYNWVYNQRLAYKDNLLETEQINRLNEIGMDLGKSAHTTWMIAFQKLKRYLETKSGTVQIIRDDEIANWLKWQRKRYAEGTLPEDYANLLKTIVFLEMPREKSWKDKIQILKDYKAKHGKFNFVQSDPIYNTIKLIRSAYTSNRLSKETLDALHEIGFHLKRNYTWEESFLAVKLFKEKNGKFPSDQDDKVLSGWVRNQRYRFKQGKLSQAAIDKLTPIGIFENIDQTSRLPS